MSPAPTSTATSDGAGVGIGVGVGCPGTGGATVSVRAPAQRASGSDDERSVSHPEPDVHAPIGIYPSRTVWLVPVPSGKFYFRAFHDYVGRFAPEGGPTK
jgi:hypothetical protein